MPVQDGDYIKKTANDILSDLETELQNEFGTDIDLTDSSVFSTLANALATTLAENQEDSLDQVYDAAYLASASGADLDKVVEIVGINRKSARHATGVVKFTRDTVPTTTYLIESGTEVRTSGSDEIAFETQRLARIQEIDDFEGSLTNHDGDTGSFSTSTTQAKEGTQSLKADATSGVFLYRKGIDVVQGSDIHYGVYLNTDAVTYQVFGWEDANNHNRVVFDEANGTHKIEVVSGGSVVASTSENVTVPTGEWLDNEVEWKTNTDDGTSDGEIVSRLIDANGTTQSEISLADDTNDGYNSDGNPLGKIAYGSGDATATKFFDQVAVTAKEVEVRAVNGGPTGNVGSNTIDTMPSPPTGIDSVNNPYPTGDLEYTDPQGDTFNVGVDEETDEELRERTKQTLTSGGTATFDAILTALLELDNVLSVTLYENKTGSDKTIDGGTLPPYSFEAVVHGGAKEDIAQALFDNKAVTSQDVGGKHGTLVTHTITSDVNGQDYDVDFTRPTQVDVDITVDIRINDDYVGDDAIRDLLVDYIGGTNSDGESILGTNVAEDVKIDTVEDIIVGDENGVEGIEVDGNGASQITATPSITTNSDNLQVISIGSNEVAITDATDGSITLNTTTV